jgi:hypothetical protein
MSAAPAFPDCQFPDDCECRKRGYELERENCAVPQVAAAADMIGVPAQSLGLRRPPLVPRAEVSRWGTVQPLGRSGDLAADVVDAMAAMGAERRYTVDEMRRVLREEQIAHGLRAEAGVMGRMIVILHSRVEKLPTSMLRCWLTLDHEPNVGDALLWNVTCREQHAISCGHVTMRDELTAQLREAAGGVLKVVVDAWAEPQTDVELDAIDN